MMQLPVAAEEGRTVHCPHLGRRICTALVVMLACTCGVTAAQAITFSSLLVYVEDFSSESTFPTTPEIDVMDGGGLVPSALSAVPPTLNGTSAHLFVTPADTRDGVFADVDDAVYSTVESNVGMRAEYSGLSTAGPGEAWVAQTLRFTRDDEVVLGGTLVATLLQLTQHDGFSSARLVVAEERIGPNFMPDYLDLRTTILSPATASLLFAGTPFTVDLEVDRSSATVVASIKLGNDPAINSETLPLVYAQDYSLSSARQYLEHRGVGDPFALDLDSFQLFAQPHVFEPLFNIDVGTFWGAPSATYAAAGSPGFWNTFVIGANSLSDTDGIANAATANLSAASLGAIEANGGETRDLLADWAADAAGWSVVFANLTHLGAYRVKFYTMGSGAAESGDVLANGEPEGSLPGVVVPSLVEGQSYAHVDTLVTDGTLTLTGTPRLIGLPTDTHLAGLQIETTVPLPEPGVGSGLAVALAGLMIAARRRLRGTL